MAPGGAGGIFFFFTGVQYGVVHGQVEVIICIHIHHADGCPVGRRVESAVVMRIEALNF